MPLQPPKDLGNLWQTVRWPAPATAPKVVRQGTIISFHYTGQRRGKVIHDPYPLVLVANIYSNAIRGVNLNYLTVPYIKAMINNFLDKPFNYQLIKNDTYIVGAFRTYKSNGISQLRMMDSDFLRGIATLSRTMDVNELDQIRAQIENIMKYQINQPVAQAGEIREPLA